MRNDSGLGSLAPASIDKVRLIRRSMRCFVFGAIGLVPILGAGLAIQALRLRKAVSQELGEQWARPALQWYWIGGMIALLAVDARFGFLGDIVVWLVLLGAQSWQLWRSFLAEPGEVWNPGRRALAWGVVFAYTGLTMSLWIIALLIYRVTKASFSA